MRDFWRLFSIDFSTLRNAGFLLLLMSISFGCFSQQKSASSEGVTSPSPVMTGEEAVPTQPLKSSIVYPTLTATPLPIRPTLTPTPEIKICSPLLSTNRAELIEIVSDGFHPPPQGQDGRHQGVDFAYYRKFGRSTIAGEIVQTVFAGNLAASINDRFPYGNVVIIETPSASLPLWVKELLTIGENDALYTLYAHLGELYPKELGESVSACQAIGTVGKSGNAGVAHLHLEMRIGIASQRFPSMAYYVADATPEERQIYLMWRTSGEFRAIDPMLVLAYETK